jgi:hypothetical protein
MTDNPHTITSLYGVIEEAHRLTRERDEARASVVLLRAEVKALREANEYTLRFAEWLQTASAAHLGAWILEARAKMAEGIGDAHPTRK